MAEEELTDAQVMEKLSQLAGTATVPEEKYNAHLFLNKVAEADDTTKVGNLKEEEVGIPRYSIRTLKELELYCRDIAEDKDWADYFKKRAEILTSTSLSKDAKLIDLAVVTRKEVANVTKQSKINKGWFSRKKSAESEI